ncbi:hypothetical protein D3C81_1863990 [compost metagenome]
MDCAPNHVAVSAGHGPADLVSDLDDDPRFLEDRGRDDERRGLAAEGMAVPQLCGGLAANQFCQVYVEQRVLKRDEYGRNVAGGRDGSLCRRSAGLSR